MAQTAKAWRLENSIRDYAWGSLDGMAQVLGISNPSQTPQAEIWLGAHPAEPSRVLQQQKPQPLDQLIHTAPAFWLGEHTRELPFLFKVLSAAEPLSLQVHPSLEQAQSGFAAEEQAGVPITAAHRNYKDPNHKPELMLALTEFRAMAGFRDPRQIAGLFAELAIAQLEPWAESLLNEGEAALEPLYVWLLKLPKDECAALVDAVVEQVSGLDELTRQTVRRLYEIYPGDPGVLSPLLLNVLELRPGEAIYLDAGLPHAYIQGTGLEIMASSDNVLRGGLTPKHIDISELVKVTRFEQQPVKIQQPEATELPGEQKYAVPVSDFCLSLLAAAGQPITVQNHGLEILLCLDGEISVETPDGSLLTLGKSQSCVIPAQAGSYQLAGQGRVARAGYAS